MNYNQGSGQSAQTPQLQQYARQRQRMPMLPPQFQNMLPQELQELKNQPQFQNALRQYYQRQQQLAQQQMSQQQLAQQQQQQQLMRQGQGMMPNMAQNQNLQSPAIPGQSGPTQGVPAQSMGQNMNMGQGLGMQIPGGQAQGQNLTQQQIYNRNLQQAYLQQQQQQKLQRSMNPNAGMSRAQMQMSMASGAPAQPGMAKQMSQYPPLARGQLPQQAVPGAQNMNAQVAAAAAAKYGVKSAAAEAALGGMAPGVPGAQIANQGKLNPAAMGALGAGRPSGAGGVRDSAGNIIEPRVLSPDPAVAKVAASMVSKETVKLPPRFAPDSVSKIRLRPLKSATEWSTKLKEEGEEVPLDVKVYEDIIQRDEQFLRKSAVQTNRQKALVDKMGLDIKTFNTIKQLRMNSISASAENQYNNSIWGEGYQGYGNGVSNTATLVILPHQNKSFTKVPGIPYTEAQMNEKLLKTLNSGKPLHLVPVRLDFDQERDRFKFRDTFLWDLNDETYPLEMFVRTLIEDYKFIPEQRFHTVLAAVNEQIKDYKKKPDKTMGEIRVPIKIDLIINNTQFTDQFEWDVLNFGESDPEEFATILCDELSLPGEFATAIAFSIREQTQLYHKALYLVGYSFDGSFIREDEVRSHLLPALRVLNSELGPGVVEDFVSTLRNPSLVADFSPSMSKLTQLEIEKIDKEMERELRRRRRHFNNESSFTYNENSSLFGTSGRGTASRRSALHSGRGVKTTLPDLSDIPKNFRTPMPSSVLPGGIDLGVPDIYGYNELIINRTQVKNTEYKPPAPPGMVTSFTDGTGSFYVKIRFSRRRP